ncbi:sialidase family protein [Corallococcus macrosporus]|uniref:BNR/Asp-box repeat-containing protein n=1 Tax=Myxococcus fulvus (strain ATCC BAA-855 / HW-1) TaxID=483219 RepID=F8CHM3_MYXFH|nr:sialidase family protein [Corallococcus macrosporus]AEI67524.1 BNR/Asp-box repeat-containing protein [Corallococcus macrosporus]
MVSLTDLTSRRRWGWLLGALLVSWSAAAQVPKTRFEESFGPALNLSGTPTFNFEFQTAVSGSNVYVVWSDTSSVDVTHVYLRRSDDQGRSFEPPQRLSSGVTPAYLPTVVAEGSKVYVAWREQGIRFRASHDNGETFEPAQLLAPHGLSPRLAAENSDVYVTWTVPTGTRTANQHLRASHDKGLSFGPAVMMDDGHGVGVTELVASNNRVYLVGDDVGVDDRPDVYVRSSPHEGVAFLPRLNLSAERGPSQPSLLARIAVKDQKVHVVWEECDDLFPTTCAILYRRSTDRAASFGPIQNLSEGQGLALAPDLELSGQHVFVAWQDNRFGHFDIVLRVSSDHGGAFSATRNLSNTPGDSGAVSLAAANAILRVVWEDTTSGATDIYYRASGDLGTSFTPIQNLSNSPSRSSAPRIITSNSGTFGYVGWLEDLSFENTDVFFRRAEAR